MMLDRLRCSHYKPVSDHCLNRYTLPSMILPNTSQHRECSQLFHRVAIVERARIEISVRPRHLMREVRRIVFAPNLHWVARWMVCRFHTTRRRERRWRCSSKMLVRRQCRRTWCLMFVSSLVFLSFLLLVSKTRSFLVRIRVLWLFTKAKPSTDKKFF